MSSFHIAAMFFGLLPCIIKFWAPMAPHQLNKSSDACTSLSFSLTHSHSTVADCPRCPTTLQTSWHCGPSLESFLLKAMNKKMHQNSCLESVDAVYFPPVTDKYTAHETNITSPRKVADKRTQKEPQKHSPPRVYPFTECSIHSTNKSVFQQLHTTDPGTPEVGGTVPRARQTASEVGW